MKRIIFIFAMLSFLPLYSQWQLNGNNMKLNAGSDKIRDFAISEDSQFIYTLADSGIISKWNAETGKNIFRKKIIPDSTRPRTTNWLFLSSDAKTYCVVYSPLVDRLTTEVIYIFDINNSNKIDSITIPFKFDTFNYYNASFEYQKVDLSSSLQNLILAYSYDYIAYPPYGGGSTGFWGSYQKNNDVWSLLNYKNGRPLFSFFSHNNDYLYLNYFSSFYSYRPTNMSSSTTASQLFDLKSNNNYYISYYGRDSQSGENPNNHPPYSIQFNSGIFSNDDKLLQISHQNTFYQYSTNPFDTIQVKSIDYPPDQNYGEFNTTLNEYFILFSSNSIDLLDFDSLITHRNYLVDSCKNIKKLSYSKDSLFLYLNDLAGSFFKINSSELFSLYANFVSNDTTLSLGDTVQFIDRSFLHPDSYLWDFGDGTTSTEINPAHVYSGTGFFNVSLTVYKNGKKNVNIKNNYIHIIPIIKADFDFNTDSSLTVNFMNNSTGQIDSLKWNFGDNLFSSQTNPVHSYKYYCNYIVTLTIYSGTVTKTKVKNINLSGLIPNLDILQFIHEFTDTIHGNSWAIKGYSENGNYLVYQILNDSTSYHGAFINDNIRWEEKSVSKKDFITKRNSGNFAYIVDSTIVNFDKNGRTYDSNSCINSKLIYCMNSLNSNVSIGYFDNHDCNYSGFNAANNLIFHNKAYMVQFFPSTSLYLNVDQLFVYENNSIIDYTLSYRQGFVVQDKKYDQSITCINYRNFGKYVLFNDFTRINDSTLIFCNNGFIRTIINYGLSLDTNVKLTETFYIRDSINLPNCSFKSLLKLSDTSFAVTGSYNNLPTVMVLNDKGSILDSITLSDRIGEFEFVSRTPDDMLLLSGYRYLTYGTKSPYFVKYNYKHSPIDTSELKKPHIEMPDNSVYPNPTTGSVTITFLLDNKSETKLDIFDQYGNLMLEQAKQCEKGDNSYNVDLTQYSAGMFYYRLQAGASSKYGSIVFIR